MSIGWFHVSTEWKPKGTNSNRAIIFGFDLIETVSSHKKFKINSTKSFFDLDVNNLN